MDTNKKEIIYFGGKIMPIEYIKSLEMVKRQIKVGSEEKTVLQASAVVVITGTDTPRLAVATAEKLSEMLELLKEFLDIAARWFQHLGYSFGDARNLTTEIDTKIRKDCEL